MKIRIRPHDPGVAQETDLLQLDGWLAELRDDGHAEPADDGNAWPAHGSDPGPEARAGHARAEATAPVVAPAPADAPLCAESTVRAVIGDQLRMPIMWCEMGSCISWRADSAALGEADARARAISAGWRIDAWGRLACPRCQQTDPGFRAVGQVVRWDRYTAVARAAGIMVIGDSRDPGRAAGTCPSAGPPTAEWHQPPPPVPVAAALTAVRARRDSRGQRTPPANPAAPPGPASPGPCTCRLCQFTEIDPPAMAAPWSDPAASTGCHWLMLAAQMAGLVTDSWLPPPHPARTGREYPPRIAMCALTPETRSARTARDFTLATLRRWGTGYNSQDIAIVVSELVTNALRHALPQPGANSPPWRARLGLLQYRPWLLCAVADPSKTPPAPRPPGSLAETGRGLHMICTLSDRWGYTKPIDTGKIVWAMFTARHAPPSRARHPAGQAVTGH